MFWKYSTYGYLWVQNRPTRTDLSQILKVLTHTQFSWHWPFKLSKLPKSDVQPKCASPCFLVKPKTCNPCHLFGHPSSTIQCTHPPPSSSRPNVCKLYTGSYMEKNMSFQSPRQDDFVISLLLLSLAAHTSPHIIHKWEF